MLQLNSMKNKDTLATILEESVSWRQEAFDSMGFFPPKGTGKMVRFPLFASRIEHTLLRVDATCRDVKKLCDEACTFGFRSVCCLPRDVALSRRLLGNAQILVATVLNFPLSGGTADGVEFECRKVIEDGADEIDMVVDLRALLRGELTAVRDGIARVVSTADDRPVKIILETGHLTPKQIVQGAAAALAGGASFAKTSTGFGPRGATVEDIRLLRAAIKNHLGIKASGGIKTHAFGLELVEAGADLLGTSSGPLCMPPRDISS